MDFKVLGPLELSRTGAPVRIGSRMQRRLLTLLLVHAGRSVSADQLVDALWQGTPPPSAPQGLHTYVSRLRRALGDDVALTSDAHGYRLDIEEHPLDARRFEELVAVARTQGRDDPRQAAETLREALAMWRGPAFAGFAHEDAIRAEAVRLDELRAEATEHAFAARLAADDPGLIADLEAFVRSEPLRERPHHLLMTALDRAGRQTEALEVFQRLRRRLADDVGLEPSPPLQRLQADILRQDSGGSRGSDGHDHDDHRDHDAHRDHGDHDDHGESGPKRHRTGGQDLRGNLPRPVTSFVGRVHETSAVCRLVRRSHLVTLTGVGGVGKTRLALHAAREVADDHPDGVWWCELAPADPDAVGHAVASALGVHQTPGPQIADSIVDALTGRRLLVVLDNCEHVVEATARLVDRILRSCPNVTILCTSREPLSVDGEEVWLVPPLPLPSDRADDAPSSRLFTDRARAHHAGFVIDETTAGAVADICRQLDGLPLAIELAAALVPALQPAEIASRLGHRFRLLTHGPRTEPRHRTLAAVVEWSYQLLDATEQRLFDRLAVFAGGFTLAAVEGICTDADVEEEDAAGLVTDLVTRSMVSVDRDGPPTRFHLLETLRQYGAQRLTERHEDAEVRARHAAWFVDLAEQADVQVRGPQEADAVAWFETEFDDLRAAHRWSIENDDADLALRLCAALYVYARFRLRDEVFTWAARAAALPSAVRHPLRPLVRAIAAHGMADRGDLNQARDVAEQTLAETPAGTPGLFVAHRVLASVALYEGRLDDSHQHTREAVAAARRDGDAHCVVWMQLHEVLTLAYDQQRDASLAAARAVREAADALGNPCLRAWALYVHAEACGDADADGALRLLERAIAMAEPVRGRYLDGVARVAVASLLARHRSAHEALAAFPDLVRHWRRVGDGVHLGTTIRNLVPLLVRVGADETAARLYGAQLGTHDVGPTYGDEADRLGEAHDTFADRLGAERATAFVEEGARLDSSAAVDLALDSITVALRR